MNTKLLAGEIGIPDKDIPKQTTKKCPNCGDTQLGEIRSQFIKICANYKCPVTEIPWELAPDQRMIT